MKSVSLGKIITQILQKKILSQLHELRTSYFTVPCVKKTTVASYHIFFKVSLVTTPLFLSQCHTTARIEKAVFNNLLSLPPTSHNNHLL